MRIPLYRSELDCVPPTISHILFSMVLASDFGELAVHVFGRLLIAVVAVVVLQVIACRIFRHRRPDGSAGLARLIGVGVTVLPFVVMYLAEAGDLDPEVWLGFAIASGVIALIVQAIVGRKKSGGPTLK